MQEFYHLLNRGVDKRNIFLDSKDYLRFVHNLFEFNDVAPANSHNNRLFSQLSQLATSDVRQLGGLHESYW